MVQPDPWNAIVNDSNIDSINNIHSAGIETQSQSFEDNFQPTSNEDSLPDSQEYLQSLGEFQNEKLKKAKKKIRRTKHINAFGFCSAFFFLSLHFAIM